MPSVAPRPRQRSRASKEGEEATQCCDLDICPERMACCAAHVVDRVTSEDLVGHTREKGREKGEAVSSPPSLTLGHIEERLMVLPSGDTLGEVIFSAARQLQAGVGEESSGRMGLDSYTLATRRCGAFSASAPTAATKLACDRMMNPPRLI